METGWKQGGNRVETWKQGGNRVETWRQGGNRRGGRRSLHICERGTMGGDSVLHYVEKSYYRAPCSRGSSRWQYIAVPHRACRHHLRGRESVASSRKEVENLKSRLTRVAVLMITMPSTMSVILSRLLGGSFEIRVPVEFEPSRTAGARDSGSLWTAGDVPPNRSSPQSSAPPST